MESTTINTTNVYYSLGKYIKQTFFGDDKRGEEVFPIIDGSLIKQYCEYSKIAFDTFESLIKHRYIGSITSRSSIYEILGFIGIQLYGASKMEKSYGLSSANFRYRIGPDILGIEDREWDLWAYSNQDDVWSRFYRWCDEEGFIVSNKCTPKRGTGRYVQYPKMHSDMILNREDLKRIAFLFFEKGLIPGEDITEREFWNIVGRYHLSYYYTKRSQNILEKNREIANRQIFQYFLSWDGEYIDGYRKRKLETPYSISLLFDKGKWTIDINNIINNEPITSLDITRIRLQKEIEKYYRFRRKNIILFAPNDVYDDYWEEVRFLHSRSTIGYALFFGMQKHGLYELKDVVKRFDECVLVRIHYCNQYNYLFAEERPYSFSGGIKIASKTFLLGALPLLTFTKNVTYWIDGEQCTPTIGVTRLSLSEGRHIIKVRGYKSIEIYISDANPKISDWNSPYSWKLSLHPKTSLAPCADIDGVVGLDFSNYSKILSRSKNTSCKSLIYDWKRKLVFGSNITTHDNPIIKMLD